METAGVITAIGTMLAGVWGLQYKQAKQNEKVTRMFLDHLEKKNGILERVTENFNKTIQSHEKEMSKVSDQLERANENQLNIQGVLSNATHALGDYYNFVKDHDKTTGRQ